MKILATGTYKSEYDYFTIVIDKQQKEIFALKNFSCRAADDEKLRELFTLNNFEVTSRFSLINSGSTIDENLIPKKYKKFTILK